jgi:hypothetical protein
MPALNRPQAEFLALPEKYRAFVGGFGSGKTWVGSAELCRRAWETPRIPSGYFGPTYPAIRDIFYPTIEEVAHDWGLRARVNSSHKEVHFYSGRAYRSTVICRSMEKPNEIVGFKIGHAMIDEIDVLPKEKATLAWRKIIARLRHPAKGGVTPRNGADITTTPEGFRFAYQTFVKDVRDKPARRDLYAMVQASTYENETNLPEGYIDGLRASYPPQLIDAYLDGRFVNLTSGAVYPDFDRRLNHCDTRLEPNEPLHVGMDFNVLNMTAVLTVTRQDAPHVVGEVTGVRDTPTMSRMLVERYGKTPDGAKRQIVVYPDASGQNTSTKNAAESDLSILKAAGLLVRVNHANPAVRDRVNAVNALILNDKGERRLKVNTHAAPVTTEALEQQAYDKNGEPDKTSGHDHPNDALGYRLVMDWPIVRRLAVVKQLRV